MSQANSRGQGVLIAFILLVLVLGLLRPSVLREKSRSSEPVPATNTTIRQADNTSPNIPPSSHPASDGRVDISQVCLPPAIPFEVIKAALDKSMAGIQATYFTHRQIRQPGGAPGLSFIYYQKGSSRAEPSLAEVREFLSKAQEKRRAAEQLMAEARQANDREKMAAAATQLEQVAGDAVRGDEFMCVEAGTSSNMPPVRMFQRGLPDWLLNEESAARLAAEHLGGAAFLAETTRMVLGGATIYTFTNTAGQQLHLDPVRKQVFADWQVAPKSGGGDLPDDARKQARNDRVRRQWEEFLTTGVDASKFNTARLTDLSGKNQQ